MNLVNAEQLESSPILQQYSVEELIPHSPPMVLIDRIVGHNDTSLQAEITITADSRFFDVKSNGVPGWVGIEYMAQAIAALAGIRAKQTGQPIKLGFLLGTRKYLMPQKTLSVGNCFQINVVQLYMDDSGLACFDCNISLNGDICVQAKLNVFEADDIKNVIEKKV